MLGWGRLGAGLLLCCRCHPEGGAGTRVAVWGQYAVAATQVASENRLAQHVTPEPLTHCF